MTVNLKFYLNVAQKDSSLIKNQYANDCLYKTHTVVYFSEYTDHMYHFIVIHFKQHYILFVTE